MDNVVHGKDGELEFGGSDVHLLYRWTMFQSIEATDATPLESSNNYRRKRTGLKDWRLVATMYISSSGFGGKLGQSAELRLRTGGLGDPVFVGDAILSSDRKVGEVKGFNLVRVTFEGNGNLTEV